MEMLLVEGENPERKVPLLCFFFCLFFFFFVFLVLFPFLGFPFFSPSLLYRYHRQIANQARVSPKIKKKMAREECGESHPRKTRWFFTGISKPNKKGCHE